VLRENLFGDIVPPRAGLRHMREQIMVLVEVEARALPPMGTPHVTRLGKLATAPGFRPDAAPERYAKREDDEDRVQTRFPVRLS
jgi:hypothetical protein